MISKKPIIKLTRIVRIAADSTQRFGTSLKLAFLSHPYDDEGYYLPELLAASNASDEAIVELGVIVQNNKKPADR